MQHPNGDGPRAQLEADIWQAAEVLQQVPVDGAMVDGEALRTLIDAGYSLLAHYQNTSNTTGCEPFVGLYVEWAVTIGNLTGAPELTPRQRQNAELDAQALEHLVNAFTRAVERNLHRRR